MARATLAKGLDYRRHETGVHEFIFTENSHAVVDAWLAKMTELTAVHPGDRPMLLLLFQDMNETLPLMYAGVRIQTIIRESPYRRPHTQVAWVHRRGFALSLAQTVLRLLPGAAENDRVRFFRTEEHDAALAWLAGND